MKASELWIAIRRALDGSSQEVESERKLDDARERVKVLTRDNVLLRNQIALLTDRITSARHHADHDSLTGLPNRRLLIDRSTQALASARRQHRQVGFMLLDLNGFKAINDQLGHDMGDQVLCYVAACLQACTRTGDTVCRYGGDEFVIMLPDLDGSERISTLAAKIHARLADWSVADGKQIGIATSIGVAICPSDGDNLRQLLKQADKSMYVAKTKLVLGIADEPSRNERKG